MKSQITRKTKKYPKTPNEIADALEEWYNNGQKGLETFCENANTAATRHATHWFEKGRARFNGFIEAIRSLECTTPDENS